MPYGWQVKLNGVDITGKVEGFSVFCSMESFCREMTVDIADPALYAQLDFSRLSETPEIEILTRTEETWISQGAFFIERPAISSVVDSDLMQGVWGRSGTAKLAEPFAPKITKAWEAKTTFFAVCAEMCALAGFSWDSAYSDIDDFVIHPYTYEVDGAYPIDVIADLALLAGAVVTADRAGHLCIRKIDYSPAASDVTITDAGIETLSERPEWPVFSNRVRITPTGALASYSVAVIIPEPCLKADGSSKAKVFAQVRDPDGEPVDGIAVAWTSDATSAALTAAATNTQEILIRSEQQRADNFYTVSVDFPPSRVDGIWAYSDTAKTVDLAAAGYEIDGNRIVLAGKLAYCDQLLVISYRAAGMAVNYLTAGDAAEDVTVTADIEGQQDTGQVFVDNPCQCPPSIKLTAQPTSIYPNGTARVLVYAEEAGPVTSGRMVFMAETSATKRGALNWTTARLGKVTILSEKTVARNEIAGVTRCELSMFAATVSAVYRADEDGNPYGGNLYSSHSGKVVDLNSIVATGADLLVTYEAQGAALNLFTAGESVGAARLTAYILTTSEEGAEASAQIRIVDQTEVTDDYPDGWQAGDGDGGYGGVGGTREADFDDTVLCRKSDGTLVECGDGKECCSDGVTFDCRAPGDCVEAGMQPCISDNVSDDPTDEKLAARFASGLSLGCSCEDLCQQELDTFGTTQGYDGSSFRTISEIVVEDYSLEEGTQEYWEKKAELEQAAVDHCLGQCDDCAGCEPNVWDEDAGGSTIARSGSCTVAISGGTCIGPYTWEVSAGSGAGFSLEHSQTEGKTNELYANASACGTATITVTDACGNSVTGYVKCTTGTWKSCVPNSCPLNIPNCTDANIETYYYFNNATIRVYLAGVMSDMSIGDNNCMSIYADCPSGSRFTLPFDSEMSECLAPGKGGYWGNWDPDEWGCP